MEASRWYVDHVTPLEAAVSIGDFKMVKYLVENGNANVNTVDNKTNTPLGLALKYDHETPSVGIDLIKL